VASNVKLTLSAHHQGKKPGDTVEVDASTAKRLIGAGVARPSTVTAAKTVGVDIDTAASKK
jgi:hypothetical protein